MDELLHYEVKLNVVAAAILDFVSTKMWWYGCFRNAIFNLYTKFCKYVLQRSSYER